MGTPPGFHLIVRFNPTAGTEEWCWHDGRPLIAWGDGGTDALRNAARAVPALLDLPANMPLRAVRAFAVVS